MIAKADICKIIALVRIRWRHSCEIDWRVGWIRIHWLSKAIVAGKIIIKSWRLYLFWLLFTSQQIKNIYTWIILLIGRCGCGWLCLNRHVNQSSLNFLWIFRLGHHIKDVNITLLLLWLYFALLFGLLLKIIKDIFW